MMILDMLLRLCRYFFEEIDLDTIGLVCNFIGTIFIFFGYSLDKKEFVEGEEDMKPGEKWYSICAKHPCFLKIGLALLIIGFLLMLLGH
jgi:uncharacterized membrane protein